MANEIRTLFNSTLAKPDWRVDWKEDAKLDWRVDWAVDTGSPANTVLPVISNLTPDLADELTVTTGTWTGTAVISYTYQWYADGLAIAGATANAFTTTAAEASKPITVEVRAVNAKGTAEVTSAAANTVVPENSVAPAITGTATVGQTLSVDDGTFDSVAAITGYTYAWFRNAEVIVGAVANTYVLTTDDQGQVITAEVSAINFAGTSAPAVSDATAAVAGAEVGLGP